MLVHHNRFCRRTDMRATPRGMLHNSIHSRRIARIRISYGHQARCCIVEQWRASRCEARRNVSSRLWEARHEKSFPETREAAPSRILSSFNAAALSDLAPCDRRRRLPGFRGPFPPPLWIRVNAIYLFACHYTRASWGAQVAAFRCMPDFYVAPSSRAILTTGSSGTS